jgi:hypothetical protein
MGTIKTKATAALREAQEKRQQFTHHLFQRDDVRGGQEFEGTVGAVLCRKNRVAGLRELGAQKVGDHWCIRAEFDLKEGYMSPPTAVAVGVCYRVTQNLRRSPPWPQDLIARVSEAVRAERVRFLGGVFECPSQQVADLARSCGAVALCTFAQVFTETSLGATQYHFNPAFLFVIGGANCRKAPPEDQPDRPWWRQRSGQSAHAARLPRSHHQR